MEPLFLGSSMLDQIWRAHRLKMRARFSLPTAVTSWERASQLEMTLGYIKEVGQ